MLVNRRPAFSTEADAELTPAEARSAASSAGVAPGPRPVSGADAAVAVELADICLVSPPACPSAANPRPYSVGWATAALYRDLSCMRQAKICTARRSYLIRPKVDHSSLSVRAAAAAAGGVPALVAPVRTPPPPPPS